MNVYPPEGPTYIMNKPIWRCSAPHGDVKMCIKNEEEIKEKQK